LRRAVEETGTRGAFGAGSLTYAQAHLSYERYREALLGFLAPSANGRSGQ